MKGVSIAIETIIYLILAITVLSVLLFFFLTQAGPAQDQYTLEAKRQASCGAYTSVDFSCNGVNGQPKTGQGGVQQKVLDDIGKSCSELSKRFGFAYACQGSADLPCIKSCCITCPNRG